MKPRQDQHSGSVNNFGESAAILTYLQMVRLCSLRLTILVHQLYDDDDGDSDDDDIDDDDGDDNDDKNEQINIIKINEI